MITIDQKGHKLSEDAAEAYFKLEHAGSIDNYVFYVNTAFRSKEYQTELYNKYQKQLDQWHFNGADPAHKPSPVAAPGTSEHERGIAVDLDTTSQPGMRKWLAKTCAAYGFYLTAHNEPWHIAYYPFGPPHVLLERHIENVQSILETPGA